MTEAQRLVEAGRLLSSAVFVGFKVPYVDELAQVMKDPQPGDLVWEFSTQLRSLYDPEHAATAVGWFARRDEKPRWTREAWDEMQAGEPYENCPVDHVWVIRPWFDPTREFTWENAEFFRLPLGWRYRLPSGILL